MSQENVEIARRVIDAVEQRNLDRLIELSDPEVEWRSAFADLAEGGVYWGHSGLRRYVRDMNDAWDLVRLEVKDALAVGNVTVLIGQIHYRGRGSGVEAKLAAGYMISFRDAKVTCFRAFLEPEQALKAVGLEE